LRVKCADVGEQELQSMERENVTLPRMQWENVKPAPEGLVLVQRFVNTRNYLSGGDLLADAEEATAWLTGHGLLEAGERVGERERGRLVEFREALRNLLLANNGMPGADTQALNDFVTSVDLRVRFGSDKRPGLESSPGGGLVERVAGRLLADIVLAEAEGRWDRLKACSNEECHWAFYDASKNRSGRWCNMQVCGARHKMRAYRKRKSRS
jgi:predicted RNA-binding Zn ribbon-like protein